VRTNLEQYGTVNGGIKSHMYKVNTSNVMNDFNEIGYSTSRHSNKYLNIGNESGYNTSRHSNK
jgi:hypothetical protein